MFCAVVSRCRHRQQTTWTTTLQTLHWLNVDAAALDQCANVSRFLTPLPVPLCACSSSPEFNFRQVRPSLSLALPSHSYEASLAMRGHTVLPVTRHKRTHPALTTATKTGTRFTYHPRGMVG